MKVHYAVHCCLEYHQANSKKSTAKNYEILLAIFNREFGDRELESITSDEVMGFLNRIGEGTRQATKKFRYALLKAFFNFLRNTIDENIPNPCNTRILRKIFREPKIHRWNILEKDLVDEMIFRTRSQRNRLMLELMACGGMRIGEVLKVSAGDVSDQKIILYDPKRKRVRSGLYPEKGSRTPQGIYQRQKPRPEQTNIPVRLFQSQGYRD